MPANQSIDVTMQLLHRDMSMRDVYACIALHAILQKDQDALLHGDPIEYDIRAACAFRAANAMVKARKAK